MPLRPSTPRGVFQDNFRLLTLLESLCFHKYSIAESIGELTFPKEKLSSWELIIWNFYSLLPQIATSLSQQLSGWPFNKLFNLLISVFLQFIYPLSSSGSELVVDVVEKTSEARCWEKLLTLTGGEMVQHQRQEHPCGSKLIFPAFFSPLIFYSRHNCVPYL